MQKVVNTQKFSLVALVFLSFAGTSFVVAQGSDLLIQFNRPVFSYESQSESSTIIYTKVNGTTPQYISFAEELVRTTKRPQEEVTQRILPFRLAVIDSPTEEPLLQQRGKGEEEKWDIRQPTFPELDINHDGGINREEAKRWATLDKQFDQVDKDANHNIDRTEFFEFETKQLKESILDFSRGA